MYQKNSIKKIVNRCTSRDTICIKKYRVCLLCKYVSSTPCIKKNISEELCLSWWALGAKEKCVNTVAVCCSVLQWLAFGICVQMYMNMYIHENTHSHAHSHTHKHTHTHTHAHTHTQTSHSIKRLSYNFVNRVCVLVCVCMCVRE